MPDVAAIVYAKNDKPGTYCGFFHDISPNNPFLRNDFLALHSLPGSGSVVNCILQPQGPFGYKWEMLFEKKTALSYIPGLSYKFQGLSPLKRPPTWASQVIKDEILKIFTYSIQERGDMKSPDDKRLKYKAIQSNPLWAKLLHHLSEQKVTKYAELLRGPKWVRNMANDAEWKQKIRMRI